MKVSEFRKLIREEVRKVLKENKIPKKGQTIPDDELRQYLPGEAQYDLQMGVLDYTIRTEKDLNALKKRILADANEALSSNGISWKFSDVRYDFDDTEQFYWTVA
jgi:hypothetical protein